jgi:hypothetical protein
MSRRLLVPLIALALTLAACGGGSSGAATPSKTRPSSTAKLDIIEPAAGSTFPGGTVNVKLSLEGARIVQAATKDLKPDEGHVHLTVDDKLQSMSFSLEDTIQATPGTHILLAEFVAGDHAPFNPRVQVTRTFVVPPA